MVPAPAPAATAQPCGAFSVGRGALHAVYFSPEQLEGRPGHC